MEKIYINKPYEKQFLIEHGKEINEVIIPEGTMAYGVYDLLLDYCPNIDNFIIQDNNKFEYSNGILYSFFEDSRKIIYISRKAKNIVVSADVSSLYDRWKGVESITVEEGNTDFTVVGQMLLNKDLTKLIMVTSEAVEVDIPEGVETINSAAFHDCKKLKKVIFPKSIEWDYRMEDIEFCEEIREIDVVIKGDRAVYDKGIIIMDPWKSFATPVAYFGNPDECEIPDSLHNVSNFEKVFANVNYFEVTSGNESLMAVDGIITDKTGSELLFYPRTRNTFQIPESIRIIRIGSCSDNNNLTEVIIPNHVENIERFAFSWCENLKKVTILNSEAHVQEDAFFECPGEQIGGVRYIGHFAGSLAYYEYSEIKLREGTIEVAAGEHPEISAMSLTPVQHEKRLKKIYLPSSLRKINGALSIPLEEIIVDKENPYYCSVDGILFSRDMKELIRYPENKTGEKYVVPEGVESINILSFFHCRHLNHVVLPDSIKKIEAYAFADTRLNKIEMPLEQISIGENALVASNPRKSLFNVGYSLNIKFRFRQEVIPLKLIDNWNENAEERRLAEFIETKDNDRKKELFREVKTSEYKRFMAFYLVIAHEDADCRKYLSRIRKKLAEDPDYATLIDHLGMK